MKTRNRLLAAMLALVMIISMLPISASAESGLPSPGTGIAIENPNGSEKEPVKEGTGGSKDQGNGGNGNVGGTPGVMPDPTYANITLACGKGGSVTDLSNTAKSGSIVRFKTVPETDYSLDTVSAHDSGGSNVAVSSMGDSHSFTMPVNGEDVTVTVQFKTATPGTGEGLPGEGVPSGVWAVTLNVTGQGQMCIVDSKGDNTNKTSFATGETVYLHLTADLGSELKSLTMNDTALTAHRYDPMPVSAYDNTVSYDASFTMPDGAVTVTAVFGGEGDVVIPGTPGGEGGFPGTATQADCSVTLKATGSGVGSIYIIDSHGVKIDKTAFSEGETVYLYIESLNLMNGKSSFLKSLAVNGTSIGWQQLESWGVEHKYAASFTMPGNAVTVEAVFGVPDDGNGGQSGGATEAEAPGLREITPDCGAGGSIADLPEKANVNDKVQFRVVPETDHSLDYVHLVIDGVYRALAGEGEHFEFDMPDCERVTVVARFKENTTPGGLPTHGESGNQEDDTDPETYSVSLVCDPANGGSIAITKKSDTTGGVDSFAEGETVNLQIRVNSRYTFKGLTVNGEAVTANLNPFDNYEYTASFTMPAQQADVTANFQKSAYTVTVAAEPAEGGSVSVQGDFTADSGLSADVLPGNSATVTAAANEGYVFVGWMESGSEVSTDTPYAFEPTGNTALTAKFKRKLADGQGGFQVSAKGMDDFVAHRSDFIYLFYTDFSDTARNVSFPLDPAGLSLYVDGSAYPAEYNGGVVKLDARALQGGAHDFRLRWAGDDAYAPHDSNTYELTLKKRVRAVYANPTDVIYTKAGDAFRVRLLDDADGTPLKNARVTIVINGDEYERHSDDEGVVTRNINVNPGEYTVTVTYDGDETHYPLNKAYDIQARNRVRMVYDNPSGIVYSRQPEEMGGGFKVRLMDDKDGTPVWTGGYVNFFINGVLYEREIDDEGFARLNINLEAGNYVVTAIGQGYIDGEAHTVEESYPIEVRTRVRMVSHDLTKFYRSDKQFEVRLMDDVDETPVGRGETVRFNINGVFYERYTNDEGVAKLNINHAPGTYVLTYYYSGWIRSNDITVLPWFSMTQESPSVIYQSEKFRVRLVNNEDGMPVKDALVTFHLNGVTYQRKTDDDGVAYMNVNVAPGVYEITASYTDPGDSARTTSISADLDVRQQGSAINYTVSVASTEGGHAGGGGTVPRGTDVTLTATPDENYRFVRWEKNGVQVSTDNPYTFTPTDNVTLTAVFEEKLTTHTVSYAVEGGSFAEGTAATETVIDGHRPANVPAGMLPDESRAPRGAWYMGDGDTPVDPASVEITGPTAFTYKFEEKVDCTVKTGFAPMSLSGNIRITGAGTYVWGSEVTLTATLVGTDNRAFYGWIDNATNAVVSRENPGSITVRQSMNLTAVFGPGSAPVTTHTVSYAVEGGSFAEGTVTTENVKNGEKPANVPTGMTPDNDHKPTGAWYLGDTPVDPAAVSITGTTTFTYKFEPKPTQYSVTVSADPAAGGTVTGGGTYTEGESVTVMITDIDEDYVFDGWYKGDERVTTSRNYTFTCAEDVALTARFIEKTKISYSLAPSSVVDLDGEPFMIKVTLTGAQGSSLPSAEYAKLTLSFNGSAVGQYIASEKAFMVAASDLEVGEHMLQLNYPGSDKYLSRSSVVNVEVVKKQALQLVDFAPTSVPLNTGYTITGRILDENDLPVKDKALIIFVPDDEGSSTGYSLDATTGNDGSFSASVNQYLPTSEGKRTISIICSADDSYKPLRESREISFVDVPTYTVTFIIENGTWDGGAAQKTVTLAENSTIQAGDVPKPQPASGYGVGAWDTDPVGQSVTGDATYTWTYFHYKIDYNTQGKCTAPAQTQSINSGSSANGSPDVEWYGSAAEAPMLSGDDLYRVYDAQGLIWFTDPDDDSSAVKPDTPIGADTTLYCKWVKGDKVVDAVSLSIFPKAGDPIPQNHWYPGGEWGELSAQLVRANGTDYEIGAVNWDPDGDTTFKQGKTYELRVQVSTGDMESSRIFLKGHATVQLDGSSAITNPEVCYALSVDGAASAEIDYVRPTESFVTIQYTVPAPSVSKPVNVTVTGNTASADYDGTEKSVSGFGFTVEDSDGGVVSGVTVTLKSAHADAASIKKTDAGAYGMGLNAAYFEVTLPDGYTLGTVKVNDGKLTISPKAVTVTANNSSKQFGAADPEFTSDVTGLIGTDTITYSVTRPRAGKDEAVGTYTGAIVATGETEQGNYTVTYKNGDFTITASDSLPLAVTPYSGVYDGTAHGAAATANVDGAEIEYSTDDGGTWSSAVPQIRDVGTITVTAKAIADGYPVKTATYTLTVTPATLSITTDSASREYNGEALTAAGMITRLISGETATVTTTGSQTYVGSSKNAYTINWVTANARNYSIMESLGTLEVTAAAQNPTITATAMLTTGGNTLDLSKLVSGAQGTPTFSIKSGGEYATLSGTTLTSGDNPGTVVITVRIDKVDMNGDGKSEYKDYTGTVSITVEKNTNPPTPTGQVETDPVSLSFGSVQQGYAPITPKPVTIRNNTAASVTISALGGLTAFEATAMDASAKPVTLPYTLLAGESINLAVNPKSDLAANDYSETLTVVYNDGTDKTLSVALSLTVTGTPPTPTTKHTVTYIVANGTWADGTKTNKTEEVEDGKSPAEIPTGMKPDANYEGGAWDTDPAGAAITGNTTFTYTFLAAANTTYVFTKGDSAFWTKGSVAALDFTVTGMPDDSKTFAAFTGIEVDSASVADGNYTATAGSVNISLKSAYLEGLAAGEHTLTARFADGSAQAKFTVKEKEQPEPVYDVRFSFTKLWQGGAEDSLDWTFCNPEGIKREKWFNKTIKSETEWYYEAWFSHAVDCYYVVEEVPEGYIVRYENVGAYADVTDRCYNGGTIINYKVPKTGDDADLALWLGCALAGLILLPLSIHAGKRKKAHGK